MFVLCTGDPGKDVSYTSARITGTWFSLHFAFLHYATNTHVISKTTKTWWWNYKALVCYFRLTRDTNTENKLERARPELQVPRTFCLSIYSCCPWQNRQARVWWGSALGSQIYQQSCKDDEPRHDDGYKQAPSLQRSRLPSYLWVKITINIKTMLAPVCGHQCHGYGRHWVKLTYD